MFFFILPFICYSKKYLLKLGYYLTDYTLYNKIKKIEISSETCPILKLGYKPHYLKDT